MSCEVRKQVFRVSEQASEMMSVQSVNHRLEKVLWEACIPPASSHQAPLPTPTTRHKVMLTPDIEPQISNERQYPYQAYFSNKSCIAFCLQTQGSVVLE